MADPRGFITTPRQVPERRPVEERVHDWQEVYPGGIGRALLPIIGEQAGRCMDCGIPFCHSGCPLGNLIPDWNDLVWRGDWEVAIQRLHATNNFPEFTGRLCPAPCEPACVVAINADPVTIKNVEVAIIDKAWDDGNVRPEPPEWLTGYTVAVVGSGPAGLAAAQQLTRAGHTVAVYERADRIGGLLRYGIPEFKMEKKHVERRVQQMAREGTVFRAGVDVGRRHDRTRAHGARTTPWCSRSGPPCGATCRHRVATSTASTRRWSTCRSPTGHRWAKRWRARSPRRTRRSSSSAVVTPGPTAWAPRSGRARGRSPSSRSCRGPVTIGRSRSRGRPTRCCSACPRRTRRQAIASTRPRPRSSSATTTAGCGRCGWSRSTCRRAGRRRSPAPTREIPAQLVLLAMGFTGPEQDGLVEQLGVELDDRGAIRRDDDYQSSVPGVFVAGDAGRGQSLIVWALAEGRACAAGVDAFLTGSTTLPAPIPPTARPLTA